MLATLQEKRIRHLLLVYLSRYGDFSFYNRLTFLMSTSPPKEDLRSSIPESKSLLAGTDSGCGDS